MASAEKTQEKRRGVAIIKRETGEEIDFVEVGLDQELRIVEEAIQLTMNHADYRTRQVGRRPWTGRPGA